MLEHINFIRSLKVVTKLDQVHIPTDRFFLYINKILSLGRLNLGGSPGNTCQITFLRSLKFLKLHMTQTRMR